MLDFSKMPAVIELAKFQQEQREKQQQQQAMPRIWAMDELITTEFPEPSWLVEGILPDSGLVLLAGKPKVGKSWLALDIAAGIASGNMVCGIPVKKQANVLYLSLEDTPRRLKSRIEQGGYAISQNCFIATSWPKLDAAGLQQLETFICEKNIAVIIIDTLQKVRPSAGRNATLYEADYAALTGVKTMVDNLNIVAVIVHHLRKGGSDDPLEEVSGSTGLTGAVDTIAVLKRGRGEVDGTLFVTGRDCEEHELALQFDRGRWKVLGNAQEYAMSQERRQILQAIAELGNEATPKAIAELLGKNHTTTKRLLRMMEVDGVVKSYHGIYIPIYDDMNSMNCMNPMNSMNRMNRGSRFMADENTVNPEKADADAGSEVSGSWVHAVHADDNITMNRKPCYACGGTDFWLSKSGQWVCRNCHPPAPGAEVVDDFDDELPF